MSYIGNSPTNIAFQTDTFSGTGSTTAFTMSVAPANTTSVLVAVTGVLQDPSTYSVSGTTLTFSAAPPSGTSNISVRYLGIPASGVTTTAYRTVTNTTATAGQTSFTIPSYTVGYIDVFRNGVYLPTTDYTATTGTTVVLNNAATVGDTITTSSFFVSSVLNALPTTGGTLSGNLVVNGDETISGNVGIGTTSPSVRLDVQDTAAIARITSTTGTNAVRHQITNTGGTSQFGRESSGGGTILSGADGYSTVLTGSGAYPMIFGTNAAERMRIDTSGNLLVGTTSAVAQITSVSSLAATAAGYFNVNAASSTATPAIYARKYDNNNTTAQIYVSFQYNQGSGGAGGIQGNGASGIQFYSSSDARLKENITELPSQLANIMALKPSKFDYIDGPKDCTGFIAQEMETVYPDAIGETPDGFKTIGGISIMETRLIKCIQEQQVLITQLQADVAALKGKP